MLKTFNYKNKSTNIILFFIWFAFFIFLRIYNIDWIPALNVDELGMIKNVESFLANKTDAYGNYMPILFQNNYSEQSLLGILTYIPFYLLINNNLLSVRIYAIVIAFFTYILLYVFIKKISNKKIATLTVLFLSIDPAQVMIERNGLDNNIAMLTMILMSLAIFNYFKTQSKLNSFLVGLTISIVLYSYALTWIILPFILVYIIYFTFKYGNKNIINLAIMTGTILIIAFPLIYYALMLLFGLPEIVTPFLSIKNHNVRFNMLKDSTRFYVFDRLLYTIKGTYAGSPLNRFHEIYRFSILFITEFIILFKLKKDNKKKKEKTPQHFINMIFLIAIIIFLLIPQYISAWQSLVIMFPIFYWFVVLIEKMPFKKYLYIFLVVIGIVSSTIKYSIPTTDYAFNGYVDIEKLKEAQTFAESITKNKIYVDEHNIHLFLYYWIIDGYEYFELENKFVDESFYIQKMNFTKDIDEKSVYILGVGEKDLYKSNEVVYDSFVTKIKETFNSKTFGQYIVYYLE